MAFSQYRLAKAIGVSAQRISLTKVFQQVSVPIETCASGGAIMNRFSTIFICDFILFQHPLMALRPQAIVISISNLQWRFRGRGN